MTPLGMLPPEMRLLLTVARPDADALEVLEAARAVRSWPLLLMLAERERALGALWRRLAPHVSSLDSEGMATLRRTALVERFRGQRQRARLADTVQALGVAGIPVMLLKGAALATVVYESFEERAMSDLDILIRPEDSVRAFRLLTGSGWRHDGDRSPTATYADHHHLPPLVDARDRTVVLEPHIALLPEGSPIALHPEDVWRDARLVRFGAVEAFVPSPVHLAVHACSHLTWSHALSSGGWRTVRDLQALTTAGGLSWRALVDGARAARATTSCYWPLALGRATGVFEVPDAVLAALRPWLPAVMTEVLTRHFLLQLFSPDLHCPSTRVGRALWTIAVQSMGPARPWSRDERFARLPRFRLSPRPQTRAQRASAWRRYLRVAVRGRAPARS